jgi:hypothetical protein
MPSSMAHSSGFSLLSCLFDCLLHPLRMAVRSMWEEEAGIHGIIPTIEELGRGNVPLRKPSGCPEGSQPR